jgi:hypothetical protein
VYPKPTSFSWETRAQEKAGTRSRNSSPRAHQSFINTLDSACRGRLSRLVDTGSNVEQLTKHIRSIQLRAGERRVLLYSDHGRVEQPADLQCWREIAKSTPRCGTRWAGRRRAFEEKISLTSSMGKSHTTPSCEKTYSCYHVIFTDAFAGCNRSQASSWLQGEPHSRRHGGSRCLLC